MPASHRIDDQTHPKLLLVLGGICWGINWPLIKIGIGGLAVLVYLVIDSSAMIGIDLLLASAMTQAVGTL